MNPRPERRREAPELKAGSPLFDSLSGDIVVEHVATRQYASGLVQSEYTVGTRPALAANGVTRVADQG